MMEKQMKRQLSMQNAMRERQMSMQIAMARERLGYYSKFYWTVLPLCIFGAFKKKTPVTLAPLLPLSFAYAFQYDMAYGCPLLGEPMMVRARKNAEDIIKEEYHYLNLPNGLPTIEEIDGKTK